MLLLMRKMEMDCSEDSSHGRVTLTNENTHFCLPTPTLSPDASSPTFPCHNSPLSAAMTAPTPAPADNQLTVETNAPQEFTFATGMEYVKLVVISCIVTTLILVVFVGISLSYSVLQIFPLVNFILLFMALTLLGIVI